MNDIDPPDGHGAQALHRGAGLTEDQVKVALGEVGDIGPARIKEDQRNET